VTFTSPHPPVDIPDVTLYDFLFADLTEEEKQRPAFVDDVETVTYGDLVASIDALAGALSQRGINPGDVVALYGSNSSNYAVALHGVLRAGATATTANALYKIDELVRQLRDSGATAIFTISALVEQALAAAAQVSIAADRVFVLDDHPKMVALRDLVAEAHPAPTVEVDPRTSIAVLPYSSGTTRAPKGVMLSHHNLVANLCQSQPWMGVTAEDRVLAVLPFFHIYGLTVVLNLTLRVRGSLVPMSRFDLEEFLRVVSDNRCTYLYVAPPIAVALAKHPLVDSYDLSHVATILSGAAPLDDELGKAVAARIGCEVRQGFGMTELSPVSHAIPDGRTDISLASVGLTLPNIDCKLLDPATGQEIDIPSEGVSAPGELCCNGPNVMVGYLNNASETRNTIDEDGFLHTGDIATVSAEGIVTVVDRLKELIKYKGYQVPPAELEAVLLTHDQIADAAVVGVRDDDGEEVPLAYVVRQADSSLTADAVISFVAGRVAPYKKVRRVEFIDAVPKSPSGKILRRALRAEQPATGDRPRTEGPTAAAGGSSSTRNWN